MLEYFIIIGIVMRALMMTVPLALESLHYKVMNRVKHKNKFRG